MDWLTLLAQAPDVATDLVTTVFEKGVVPGAVIIAMAYVIIKQDKRQRKDSADFTAYLKAQIEAQKAEKQKSDDLLKDVTDNIRLLTEKIRSSRDK